MLDFSACGCNIRIVVPLLVRAAFLFYILRIGVVVQFVFSLHPTGISVDYIAMFEFLFRAIYLSSPDCFMMLRCFSLLFDFLFVVLSGIFVLAASVIVLLRIFRPPIFLVALLVRFMSSDSFPIYVSHQFGHRFSSCVLRTSSL